MSGRIVYLVCAQDAMREGLEIYPNCREPKVIAVNPFDVSRAWHQLLHQKVIRLHEKSNRGALRFLLIFTDADRENGKRNYGGWFENTPISGGLSLNSWTYRLFDTWEPVSGPSPFTDILLHRLFNRSLGGQRAEF